MIAFMTAACLWIGLCLWVLWMALAVPVVEWSWTTGECVRVLPPEAGRCDQLPERYERVWVR